MLSPCPPSHPGGLRAPSCLPPHDAWGGREANLCSLLPAPSWHQQLSTSPQASRARGRGKAKGVQGRGRRPKVATCPLPSLPPQGMGAGDLPAGAGDRCLPAGSSTDASSQLKVFPVFKDKPATPPPCSLPPGPPSPPLHAHPGCPPLPHVGAAPRPALGARTHPTATPGWGLTPRVLPLMHPHPQPLHLLPNPTRCQPQVGGRSLVSPPLAPCPQPQVPAALSAPRLLLCATHSFLRSSAGPILPSPPPALLSAACPMAGLDPSSLSILWLGGVVPRAHFSPSPLVPSSPSKGSTGMLPPNSCPQVRILHPRASQHHAWVQMRLDSEEQELAVMWGPRSDLSVYVLDHFPCAAPRGDFNKPK